MLIADITKETGYLARKTDYCFAVDNTSGSWIVNREVAWEIIRALTFVGQINHDFYTFARRYNGRWSINRKAFGVMRLATFRYLYRFS